MKILIIDKVGLFIANNVHFLFYIILINNIKLNKIEIINHYIYMYINHYL